MSGVLEAVLNSLWQAVGVALAVWLALKVMPRINAATRYAVWWAALAIVVILPVVSLTGNMRPRRTAPVWLRAPAAKPQSAVLRQQDTENLYRPYAPVRLNAGNWPNRMLGVWSIASLLLLGRIGWSYRYLRLVKRRSRPAARELCTNFNAWGLSCGVHRRVSLLVSSEIRSPMAVGFWRPAVILPEPLLQQFTHSELTQADLDHVLLHELAHIARRDDWTNLTARLAGALLIFHPVVAWLVDRIDREREIACDDWVVAHTGAARPYAASLARLFELCRPQGRIWLATGLASGMAGNAGHLGDRIEMLLRRGRDFTPRTSMLRVAALSLTLLAFVAAGARVPRWIAFSGARVRVVQAAAQASGAQATGSFLAALVAAGYGDLTVDEIVELKVQGVSAEFMIGISQAGWGKLPVRQLIELKVQGVAPGYLRKMREAGLRDLTIPEVIELKRHGVEPDYIREIQSYGFGPYSAREAIELKLHGLRPQDFREAGSYGRNLTLRQIVRLKQAGVI